MMKEIKREDNGIILDFLPQGHALSRDRRPIAQMLGDKYFTLLEGIPKIGITLKVGDKVYLGQDKRDEIHHISGRISINSLTNFAKQELDERIAKIVSEREEEFIKFFNKAAGISIRMHEFEILPGIGKKHMWRLLEERKIKLFESFEDIQKRVTLIPDPKKVIIKRILLELDNGDKYKLFTV